MAKEIDPTSSELTRTEKNQLFAEFAYENFNGPQPQMLDLVGGVEVKIRHGFGFTPSLDHLTVRKHLAMGDVGEVYLSREPDEEYIYLKSVRSGKAKIEIAHPNFNRQGSGR